MATKTITITEAAYKRLARLKSRHESFSDIITRITGSSRLKELQGLLSSESGAVLEDKITANRHAHRKQHAARTERLQGKLA